MKLYQAIVYYSRPASGGFTETAGLPTFYLRDDMQMITSEHDAGDVVRGMLRQLAPDATFHISIAESIAFEPMVIGA